ALGTPVGGEGRSTLRCPLSRKKELADGAHCAASLLASEPEVPQDDEHPPSQVACRCVAEMKHAALIYSWPKSYLRSIARIAAIQKVTGETVPSKRARAFASNRANFH